MSPPGPPPRKQDLAKREWTIPDSSELTQPPGMCFLTLKHARGTMRNVDLTANPLQPGFTPVFLSPVDVQQTIPTD